MNSVTVMLVQSVLLVAAYPFQTILFYFHYISFILASYLFSLYFCECTTPRHIRYLHLPKEIWV